MYSKEEYPPLLPLGFHDKTIQELRALCVDSFKEKGSSTREGIMDGLQFVVQRLVSSGIIGEIWVDGSFVTHKIDPDDVDILLMVDGKFFDNASAQQKEVMKWVQANLKDPHLCDSKFWVSYDRSHPDYAVSEWWHAYWLKMFGFYRDDGPNAYETKGMVRLLLPACMQ